MTIKKIRRFTRRRFKRRRFDGQMGQTSKTRRVADAVVVTMRSRLVLGQLELVFIVAKRVTRLLTVLNRHKRISLGKT